MPIIEELKNVKPTHFIYAMMAFVSIFASGFLTLYLYKPNLLIELDIFKFMFFSISLTMPIVFLNFFSITSFHSESNSGISAVSPQQVLFAALTTTAFTLFSTLFCSYLLHTNFKVFLLIFFVIELLAVRVVATK